MGKPMIPTEPLRNSCKMKGPWRSVWGIGARGRTRSVCVCADTELPNYGLKKLATG
jgi:hypothetical protein